MIQKGRYFCLRKGPLSNSSSGGRNTIVLANGKENKEKNISAAKLVLRSQLLAGAPDQRVLGVTRMDDGQVKS